MNKDIFSDANGMTVRKAVSMAIDRSWIVKNIVGDDVVPNGPIPPGLSGFDPALKDYSYDLVKAKSFMLTAGYPLSDKRLKQLTLLHTDGAKTIEIAKWIKRYLINLGVDLSLVSVSYSDYDAWQKEMRSGKYHMFLMGYKGSLFDQILLGDKDKMIFHTTDCSLIPSAEAIDFLSSYDDAVAKGYAPDPVCSPRRKGAGDAFALLKALFYTGGEANFMSYSNKKVDSLLDEVGNTDPVLNASREEKLKEVSSILVEDPPIVPIFYITKL
jgi:ABC-type transport system substrate-binding protein